MASQLPSLWLWLAGLSFLHLIAASGVIVPLFVFPTENCANWSPLISAITNFPSVRFSIVVNPDDGPGSGAQPENIFQTCIPKLRAAGGSVTLLGYVVTDIGNVAAATVQSTVRRYSGWNSAYRPDGIFFDQVPSLNSGLESRYRSYVEEARGSFDGPVVFSSGDEANSAYISMVNYVITASQSYTTFKVADLPINDQSPASKQGVMLHGGPSQTPSSFIKDLAEKGFAQIYVTDGKGFENLPSDIIGLAAAILASSGGSGTSAGSSAGSNPTTPPSSSGSSPSTNPSSTKGSGPSASSPSSSSSNPGSTSGSTPGSADGSPTDPPADQSGGASNSKPKSTPVGGIAGGVVGGIVILLLGLFCLWRRRKRSPYYGQDYDLEEKPRPFTPILSAPPSTDGLRALHNDGPTTVLSPNRTALTAIGPSGLFIPPPDSDTDSSRSHGPSMPFSRSQAPTSLVSPSDNATITTSSSSNTADLEQLRRENQVLRERFAMAMGGQAIRDSLLSEREPPAYPGTSANSPVQSTTTPLPEQSPSYGDEKGFRSS